VAALGLAVFLLGIPAAEAAENKNRASEDESALYRFQRQAPRCPPLLLFASARIPDPIEKLLDDAEAAYQRGEALLREGRRAEARVEFDRATDILLSSRWPVRDDPRLLRSLDSLVERIHQWEVEWSREEVAQEARPANGETPGDVPAPMEEIPPLTFPVDPALRAQLEQELRGLAHDLPIELNERVLSAVKFFQTARGRRIIENGLRRAGRYREMIHQVLDEEGLPRDLIYLAQAESAFQPNARSRARAVGLWQFVKWRGMEYGLQVDWWIDERRDPMKSTRAAARHLKDLYEQFGDWYLAMAAYNCGPGCVSRAQQRGRGADYWEMIEKRLLPRETRNYVPIILAVTLMAKEPQRYGIEVMPDPPVRADAVTVGRPVDLRAVADALNLGVSALEELNPHVLRGVTPPDRNDFLLYVPQGMGERLRAALPEIPEAKRVLWARHQVRRGETLSRIAARYDTSAQAVAQANGISVRTLIHPGQVLVIPQGPVGRYEAARPRGERASRTPSSSRPRAGSGGTYRVERGDTLSTIAARHGVSVNALAAANGLTLRSTIRVGQRLTIPGQGDSSDAGQRAGSSNGARQHRVRSGETLWGLSQRYGTSVSKLRDANPFLAERELRAGDQLIIPE
jgi:membrane-bound lytic murein transglycosylase D